MTHAGVQCDEDYFNGMFRNLCSMFKVMGFILRRCINMAKIIVRHKMFNVKRVHSEQMFNLTIFTVNSSDILEAIVLNLANSNFFPSKYGNFIPFFFQKDL